MNWRAILAMNVPLFCLAAIVVTLALDAAVRPRPRPVRSLAGMALHALMTTAAFAIGLILFASPAVAAATGIVAVGVLAIASNAKRRMLGEPLVFSDLALIGAMLRHPRFYFTAVPPAQRVAFVIGGAAVAAGLVTMVEGQPMLRPVGLVLLAAVTGLLWLLRGRAGGIAAAPDLAADVRRHGLLAVLLLYWWRWRGSPDPPARPAPTAVPPAPGAPRIIIVVQCESFADPVDLVPGQPALPGLSAARDAAWQYGDLLAPGFGAYTMRTEYGVLFGREEEALGFRRYDPFLTAAADTSYALPTRLPGYRASFVHPHDLRFYARDRLMPASGFDTLVGEDAFAGARGGDRYVDDRTLGRTLAALADAATGPALFYAVTMENHGPWDGAGARDAAGRLDTYLRHLHSSDAMLGDLVDRLSRDGRPALLVFFGDHRPSIPGVTAPDGPRHTPYVMIRFGPDADGGPGRVDLTPAGLHHAILAVAGVGAAPGRG